MKWNGPVLCAPPCIFVHVWLFVTQQAFTVKHGESKTTCHACEVWLKFIERFWRYLAVHHAVGISRQRNSSCRPSRVNIMAQCLCTPDPSLSPTHLSIRRGRATTTHYTHHQVSVMVSRNTTLVPSLGLRIGPVCEAGLSASMRRERVPPQRI